MGVQVIYGFEFYHKPKCKILKETRIVVDI